MREPRVQTGKRTMVYMAISLALTAAGIILCYLLLDVRYADPDHTMNSLLAARLAGHIQVLGLPVGRWFVFLTLLSEALLLFVAAQAGFIDGPRVMANMAHDSWFPHRFSALSDRLTMQNGVLLMGGAGLAMLLYTGGRVDALVVMYSINVFVTFSLTQIAMIRYWVKRETREKQRDWKSHIWIHVVGGVLCVTILTITVAEKFAEGGWLTIVATSALIAVCMAIRRHYAGVFARLKRLDEILAALPSGPAPEQSLDPSRPTAVLLVGGYSGLGVHSLLTVLRLFPRYFKNVLFVTVGVVDSATFQGVEEVDRVRAEAEEGLRKYVQHARADGLAFGLPPLDGNRGGLGVGAGRGRDRSRVPARHLLRRKAHLRAGAVVRPPAPQRDGVRDAAAAPVRRPAHGGPAGARAGVNDSGTRYSTRSDRRERCTGLSIVSPPQYFRLLRAQSGGMCLALPAEHAVRLLCLRPLSRRLLRAWPGQRSPPGKIAPPSPGSPRW